MPHHTQIQGIKNNIVQKFIILRLGSGCEHLLKFYANKPESKQRKRRKT